MKVCRTCALRLPLDLFYRYPRNADGLTTQCKTCANEENRRWRESNRERCNHVARAYRLEHIDECRRRNRERAAKDRLSEGGKERANAKARKARAKLTDHYVKTCLIQITGLPREQLPSKLVDAKREQLGLLRLSREMQRAADAAKETK